MGEIFHHPMTMSHAHLRHLVFTRDIQALEQYGEEIVRKSPERRYAKDSLEIVAALAQGEYVAAEALIETAKYRHADSPTAGLINQTCLLFSAFIDFAFGRFSEVRAKADSVLSISESSSQIETNDRLALYKLLADTAFLLDDYNELEKIAISAQQYDKAGDRDQAHYFLNMINALVEFQRGDFKSAFAISERAIAIASKYGYVGVASDLTARNIRYRSLAAMARFDEAELAADETMRIAERDNNWPWYFVTKGSIIKRLAQENRMKEAISGIRELSEQIQRFTFKHELTLFVDATEIYVRFLLSDTERIQVLLKRLPELLIVKQISTYFGANEKTDNTLQKIELLPEGNRREQLYKVVAFAEFYSAQESKALPYARRALALTEETGYVQFLLLQVDLYNLFLKASKIEPTAFTEEFARRLTEHMKKRHQQQRGNLVEPLTNRELEVLQHLATGKPISAIAASLHVSMNTMKTHLRNAYHKLEVDGRESAVTKAKELLLF